MPGGSIFGRHPGFALLWAINSFPYFYRKMPTLQSFNLGGAPFLHLYLIRISSSRIPSKHSPQLALFATRFRENGARF
jgi:hypothetical protein